ncbi:MAG: translation initiation factor IF-2 N-terminal domain-containing protein, partial [Candidatus Binataceae bacterium]
MARKRIKTLAHDWGIPVEEVLASCQRLKLPHALSESVLLSPEETTRVRADLDDQAHRAAVMRRETTVETSAGTVVEKRLNATVVRRRHAEPAPGTAPAEPFHFEMDDAGVGAQSFVAPMFDEPLKIEPLPELQMVEPAPLVPPSAIPPMTPAIGPADSSEIERPSTAVNGAAKRGSEAAAESIPAPTIEPVATAMPIAAASPEAEREAAAIEARPAVRTTAPTRVAPANMPGATVVRRQFEAGRTLNLTNRAHTAAPSMDEGQAGPKVLGKIDLRKPATARPAPPTGVRPGGPPRPGMPPRPGVPSRPGAPTRPGDRRFGAPAATPGPENFGPPPSPDSAKPGARTIKKKKVVKRGTPDIAAEREMRGLRVPRKRRALPGKELHKTEITTPRASKRVVRITEGVTVGDLARNMGVKAAEIIKQLMGLGVMST